MTSRIRESIALGIEFWNDSCDLAELASAVTAGAAGATSNPLIVAQAVQADPATWHPVIDDCIARDPTACEDALAWRTIERVIVRAALLLAPRWTASDGSAGMLCAQVDPVAFRDAARMVAHGRHLAQLAPNVAIKVPATAAGIAAIEELTAAGIATNATVSFSVAQAVAAAEAVERGLLRCDPARRARLRAYTTVMVGRLDDHLKRVAEQERISIEPGWLDWAGIAVFKRVAATFRERNWRATPLAAAYRHHLQWSELIGPGVVLSMPFRWWQQFDRSDVVPERSLERAVDPRIVAALRRQFADFRRAYDPAGLAPGEFTGFGPSRHTLSQFAAGRQQLVEIVRARLLGA